MARQFKIINIIKKKNLNLLFNRIKDRFDIYLPIQDLDSGLIDFMKWENIASHEVNGNITKEHGKNFNSKYKLNLTEKTKKSPKFLLFPLSETLFEFEYKKDLEKPDVVNMELMSSVRSDSSSRNKIIFGIKPCDMSAIKMFDLVFGAGGKQDPYYLNKRNSSIFISVGCSKVHPDCFCTSVGGHPFNFEHADIGMIEMEEVYAILKIGENVKWFVEENRDLFEKENPDDENYYAEIDKIISESEVKMASCYNDVSTDEIPDSMEASFNSDIWKKVTKKCISCGACTYVCPTCVCFNICDEIEDLGGERFRCWDYCMNYYYTLEASGHNPRSDIYQRYRNKINCKYNYFYKRNKNIYCVGCGRCIEVCPVGMDIREIVNSVLDSAKKVKNIDKK